MGEKKKVLLIGWDAADWKIIGPLLAKGLMPSLKSMISEGVYGNMGTMNPPYSPMLWTSVATGKTPDKHGILGFMEVLPNGEGVVPVTTHSRKTRAVWNIFHNQGLRSNLVGWWPSYPAEPINGLVVSDVFQKVSKDPNKLKPIKEGGIYPPSAVDEYKTLRMFPWELTKEHILPFIPKAAEIDQTKKKNALYSFSKITSENVSIHNAATRAIRTTQWDFMAVYYDYIDHMSHAFMKFHPPHLKGIPENLFDRYKDVINSAYRFQDMMLGRLLELVDNDTTVILISDHGYESGVKRIINMPNVQAAPALEHRQFGIFVAKGPNIKKNKKIFGLGLIDVAPTLLTHFNLPVGEDMDGNAILDMYVDTPNVTYIDSWDKVEGDFGELKKDVFREELNSEETLQQLIELGYIDKPDEKIEKAVHKAKCDLKHNLAKVKIGKKDYVSAKNILLELIEDKQDVDPAPFYFDMVRVSLKEKNYEVAEKYIESIRTSKSTIKYNLSFYESEILAASNRPSQALKILEKIVNKNLKPEVWYRIGVLHFQMANYKLAIDALEKAIEIEPDTAKYHLKLAETYFELKEYEEAVEESIVSIELVKHFPRAHYILGKSLEKLGDLENAKNALLTAKALRPKGFNEVVQSLENINEKIEVNLSFNNKVFNKYRKDQIVIVSGLPRSGTSLMMQMLDKGGIDILQDDKRKADISNPKGYYEYEPVMSIHKDNSWLHKAQDKAVKIVAPLLKDLDPKYRYKVIFMKRDLHEIIKSQQIMIGKDDETFSIKLFNAFQKQIQVIEKWKDRAPNIEILYIDYSLLLENPDNYTTQIKDFIATDMNIEEMKKAIDKKLYRNKKK